LNTRAKAPSWNQRNSNGLCRQPRPGPPLQDSQHRSCTRVCEQRAGGFTAVSEPPEAPGTSLQKGVPVSPPQARAAPPQLLQEFLNCSRSLVASPTLGHPWLPVEARLPSESSEGTHKGKGLVKELPKPWGVCSGAVAPTGQASHRHPPAKRLPALLRPQLLPGESLRCLRTTALRDEGILAGPCSPAQLARGGTKRYARQLP